MHCDEEIFEINDFSTSSDWERFIADVEEILTQWNLSSNSVDNSSLSDSMTLSSPLSNSKIVTSKLLSDPRRWQQRQESIKYRKVAFSLQYFQFKKDPLSTSIGSTEQSNRSHSNQSWHDMCSIENDWPVTGHPLVRYYGLTQFLLLIPLNGETIGTEDRARQLLAVDYSWASVIKRMDFVPISI
ncbi:rab3 GTPase-activating protein catalytic subunit-like protein [Euroglyphus maynei]|uniref:Rab3 GTPase-activating protein catalytic subunit-like protein n=1 Tax=Euroglyphus maynei TaxID=6958 RepID=A0A1Y3BH17_EURMA|nr:rab3 GTPase-activating protein catalytic subunit-like protein [Euroglyphus maynei]